jgi:hypothetical protein
MAGYFLTAVTLAIGVACWATLVVLFIRGRVI